MKTILCSLLLALLPVVTFALDVSVIDLDNVQVNNLNAGKIEDVMVNYPTASVTISPSMAVFVKGLHLKEKESSVKRIKALKDKSIAVPQEVKDEVGEWIETDANDPVKAKKMKDANIVPPAEGIGATISQGAKDKIENAK